MKIPDRIIGVLELNNTKLPFELLKDTFELRLYGTSECDDCEWLPEGVQIYNSNVKKHKWVDKVTIKGRTSEGFQIYIGTQKKPDVYNGYRTYNVAWYYLTDEKSNKIDEVHFLGPEINCFYDPTRAFQSTVSYKPDDITSVESLSVQTTKNEDLNCGHFKRKNVRTDVLCSAHAKLSFYSESPFDSYSRLKLKFSNSIDIDALVIHAMSVQCLLTYVSYRTNIKFTDISTYISIEDGKIRNCGKLVFKGSSYEESNYKAKKRIIKAENLNVYIAKLLSDIEREEIPYRHFCKSIEDISYYTASRIIMILAAFESEYRNAYGQDTIRSEEYKKTKENVAAHIKNYAESLDGRQKKYAKGFARGVLNSDMSYGDNLQYAFEDCKTIMEPFVKKHFKGSYRKITEDVSTNINELRNGIAHSRLNLKIKARNLTDIKLVEEMFYVVRLKKMGIKDEVIQKSINDLFQENVF